MASDNSIDLTPEFLAEMVKSVGVGVGIYTQDGRYVYVNQSYANLFNVIPSELVGEPLWDVVPEIEADKFDTYWTSFQDDETREAETVHRYNGQEVPVATVTTQRSINGTRYHFGTTKDISERKAQERELKHQNERLESFAGVISHDLRNPLNVAQGYIDLLQTDIDRDELHLVDNALDRMSVLITELLELAQSRNVDETSSVSIKMVAKQAWQSVDTHQAELSLPETNPQIRANRSRLQQLFENLLRNAIEHGGPGVSVTVETTADGFSIADDGSGIPSDKRDRIFETGYTTNDSGTGFGLSIVQQIISGHEWSIQVTESSEGGAKFEITSVEFAT